MVCPSPPLTLMTLMAYHLIHQPTLLLVLLASPIFFHTHMHNKHMIASGVLIRLAASLPSTPPPFVSFRCLLALFLLRPCLHLSFFFQRFLLLLFVLSTSTLSLRDNNLCPRLYPLTRSFLPLLVDLVQHPSPRSARMLTSTPPLRLFSPSFPFHFHITTARLPLTWCSRP